MKLLIVGSMLITSLFTGNPSFYQFNIVTVNGKTISCASFKAKKVIITVVNAEDPSASQLRYLDSLQQALPNSLQVIAIPTTDFTPGLNLAKLQDVQSKAHFLITEPLNVKKETGQDQLCYWLTHFQANIHFDNDADGEGQVFIISEQGNLYSVLSSGVPNDVIGRLINQTMQE
jgi:glutathione peroxidase-family protein